ncbi:hypothetical protein EUX57_17655 [Pseudomonas orientalis]|uniref:Uncharacterized protein n=1 Tax=Pseudomonas orientalis TaxID=76758 RepID=A0A4Q7CWU0_9PSED|nr:hypothetical protein EUX57_17655 [Pseudomonas orientalis]
MIQRSSRPSKKPWPESLVVGASLLAKIANHDACTLDTRGVLRLFASKLAPTGIRLFLSP